jgi:phage baseplate assembly protein W
MAVDLHKSWLGVGWATPVGIDPITGGIARAAYEVDIRPSIIIILSTGRGERLMRPDFGCGIHDLVFETINQTTITRMTTAITQALVKYEARIEILSVNVNPIRAEDGLLLIELQYRVRRTNQTGNLVYPFYFKEGGAGMTSDSRG